MSQSFGSRIRNILVGILISLLVIAFAVWGINDVFSPTNRAAVMTLGDEEISTQEFDTAFRQELRNLAQTEGRQLPHQEAFDRGIHSQVLGRLLTSKVIEIDANDLGIGINPRSTMDYLETFEVFKDDITGKFSKNKLGEVLYSQRPAITIAQFERDLIRDLRQQQTIPAISGGVEAPLKFAELSYQYLTEQRKASVLTINDKAVPPPPEPTDDELKTFIDNNKVTFTAPEYRKVTLIRLETTDVIPDLTVTEEELKSHYDYQLSLKKIGTTETRSVIQINAQDEASANKIVERINQGEDPYVVAALLNLIEPTHYDNVIKDAISDPSTAEAAFEMEAGTSRTILGTLGVWYAVHVTHITPATQPDFNSVREELEADLMDGKAKDQLFDITAPIEDALTEGQTLEEAAKAGDVPFASLDYIDRSGITRDGRKLEGLDRIPGIATDDTLLKEIFLSSVGEETDMFETSNGGWASLRVDDIIESQLRPFEDIRSQAAVMWKREKTGEALDELMLELSQKARNGESLDTLLASLPEGSATIENVILLRGAPGNNLGPTVTVGLLEAGIDEIKHGHGVQPLSRQVAKLTEIISNSDGLAGQYADILRDQITAAVRNDLLSAYQNAVLSDYPQKDYPNMVRQTLGLDTNN